MQAREREWTVGVAKENASGGEQVLIRADELQAKCSTILEHAGLNPVDAAIAAECLVQSDLRGVDVEGVTLLPIYVQRLKMGLSNPHPRLVVLREAGAVAVIDGDYGLGQVVGTLAMERAIALADTNGVGLVGVRNSTHFSMAANYAMKAMRRDMIGIVLNSGRALIAPTGGVRAMVCDGPMAIAVPTGKELPLVLDMALTTVARGKIKVALQRGEPIPAGWATDSLGQPTTDPLEALTGLLSPVGGAKGYGLALMNGILAGILMGGPFAWQVGSVYDDLDRPQRVGHMMIAIAISNFMPVDEFKSRVDEMIREIRSCPRMPDVARVYLPGEMEFKCHENRSRDGIPLPRTLWEELCTLAQHPC